MNMLRHNLHYRRESFSLGLQQAGFKVVDHIHDPKPEDVLVVWNLYGGYYEQAQNFKAHGARVVVAENGWLGKDWLGGEWFALCLDHHVGAGRWSVGGPDRWDNLAVELLPWRSGGSEVVILGQRGIGERGLSSPASWAERTRARIGCGRIRNHPGNGRFATPQPPLVSDLADASDVVTWASGAALKALLMGIPVWNDCTQWIGASACRHVADFERGQGKRDDAARLEMFRRLAWAMWTLDEIRTGDPFRRLFTCA